MIVRFGQEVPKIEMREDNDRRVKLRKGLR